MDADVHSALQQIARSLAETNRRLTRLETLEGPKLTPGGAGGALFVDSLNVGTATGAGSGEIRAAAAGTFRTYVHLDNDANANNDGLYVNARWNGDSPSTYSFINAAAFGGKALRLVGTPGGSFVMQSYAGADNWLDAGWVTNGTFDVSGNITPGTEFLQNNSFIRSYESNTLGIGARLAMVNFRGIALVSNVSNNTLQMVDCTAAGTAVSIFDRALTMQLNSDVGGATLNFWYNGTVWEIHNVFGVAKVIRVQLLGN